MWIWHAVLSLGIGSGCEEEIIDGQVSGLDLLGLGCVVMGRTGVVNNAIHARVYA